MQRLCITFQGRVQGVGFRATARHIAADFDITGWVKNEPDSSVLMEVQGEQSEVNRYLDTLHQRMGRLIQSESSANLPPNPSEHTFDIHF